MDLHPFLDKLKKESNFRFLPEDGHGKGLLDFSSNDYLGIAADSGLRKEFLESFKDKELPSFSSSASRLLSSEQDSFYALENFLSSLYDNRSVLLFNSGYHANTGIIQALGSLPNTLVVADKLVHASIIDGIGLSKAPYKRFRHNDLDSLETILRKEGYKYDSVQIVTESVFSMDGDRTDIAGLVELKNKYPNILLYVDEAHAFGVEGENGLGLSKGEGHLENIDILIGTFGKAAASFGAFVVTTPEIKDFLINKARSLIFSTALPPMQAEWTIFVLRKLINMDKERKNLKELGSRLNSILNEFRDSKFISSSHIQPLIIGDSQQAIDISGKLKTKGFKVLPIRRPTVPLGTERLRFSLNASFNQDDLDSLSRAIEDIYAK